MNNVIRQVAPPLYWDPNQTCTENAGGSGTWTPGYSLTGGGPECWFDPYLGMDVAFHDVYTAIFAGAGGTVTLDGTASPAALTFCSDNYVLAAAAAGDGLVLPPAGTCVNVAANQVEIDAPIAGAERPAGQWRRRARAGRCQLWQVGHRFGKRYGATDAWRHAG